MARFERSSRSEGWKRCRSFRPKWRRQQSRNTFRLSCNREKIKLKYSIQSNHKIKPTKSSLMTWSNITPGPVIFREKKKMLKSMSVNKDFLTWLLIGWQHSCQPIRSHVWKFLFWIQNNHNVLKMKEKYVNIEPYHAKFHIKLWQRHFIETQTRLSSFQHTKQV